MSLVKEILAKADKLPSLPGVLHQIMAQLGDPNFSFTQIMETVRLDPGITAHVLRMCNSPFYGLRTKISSLEQALTFLGAKAITEIVLSSEVVKYFKQGQEGYRLARGELWKHSMATALLAQKLAERVGYRGDRGTLFTAALLHDVGKLLLSEYVGADFDKIEGVMLERDLSFVEAEREVLGVDHALLGGVVVRKWNFPESIVTAIAFHHNPLAASRDNSLTNLVALANLLTLTWGQGGGAEGLAAPVPDGLMKAVGMRSRDLDPLGLEIKDIVDKAEDLLEMAT